MNIIFGPVRSRRFGNSLGIDLSPTHKQCNFDCLYCELAPAATIEHQNDTVEVEQVLTALKEALAEHHGIDVITFTANGEPTLYPQLERLLHAVDTIKGDAKTLILTNSATLTDPKVYQTLLQFDRVKLSLDAITPDVFKKIDRPHHTINIDEIVTAVKAFAKEYRGELYIEILFVYGLNDSDEEVAALNDALLDIPCKRIDLGSIDRPPAYPVQGISYGELHAIAHKFDASLPIHIASRQHAESCISTYTEEEIINTLDKRPLTPDDIELLFNKASKERLSRLLDEGKIIPKESSGITFYILAENLKRKRQKS